MSVSGGGNPPQGNMDSGSGSGGGNGLSSGSVPASENEIFQRLGLIDPKSVQNQSQDQVQEDQGPDWETDDNPYKAQVKELQGQIEQRGYDSNPRATFDQQQALIEREAGLMLQQFMTGPVAQGKMDPGIAQALVNMAKENAVLKAERDHERQTLMPAAKRQVAEDIAKQLSTRTVKINPADLMNEPSVDAMRTRAKMTVEMQRDGKFQQRRQNGSDRVEGASGRQTLDENTLSGMSPEMKIKVGLKLARQNKP